jgi:hypothetical protein
VTPLAETTERTDVLEAPTVEPLNGEPQEKIKIKKRKKHAEDAGEGTPDGEEKKKKKKKKERAEE